MRRDDFFVKPPQKPVETILFAGRGFAHIEDECFVIADGVASLPHAQEAGELARDTALWAYKVVRQRPFYWDEKLEFLKRIFRTTNLTLWQKRRDPGYADGLAASLVVLLTEPKYFWVGSAGSCNAFLFRDGLIDVLLPRDVEGNMILTSAAGFSRKQLIPHRTSERLLPNDVLILANDSLIDFVKEDEFRSAVEATDTTKQSIERAADVLVDTAQKNGSKTPIFLCLVKTVTVHYT